MRGQRRLWTTILCLISVVWPNLSLQFQMLYASFMARIKRQNRKWLTKFSRQIWTISRNRVLRLRLILIYPEPVMDLDLANLYQLKKARQRLINTNLSSRSLIRNLSICSSLKPNLTEEKTSVLKIPIARRILRIFLSRLEKVVTHLKLVSKETTRKTAYKIIWQTWPYQRVIKVKTKAVIDWIASGAHRAMQILKIPRHLIIKVSKKNLLRRRLQLTVSSSIGNALLSANSAGSQTRCQRLRSHRVVLECPQ